MVMKLRRRPAIRDAGGIPFHFRKKQWNNSLFIGKYSWMKQPCKIWSGVSPFSFHLLLGKAFIGITLWQSIHHFHGKAFIGITSWQDIH